MLCTIFYLLDLCRNKSCPIALCTYQGKNPKRHCLGTHKMDAKEYEEVSLFLPRFHSQLPYFIMASQHVYAPSLSMSYFNCEGLGEEAYPHPGDINIGQILSYLLQWLWNIVSKTIKLPQIYKDGQHFIFNSMSLYPHSPAPPIILVQDIELVGHRVWLLYIHVLFVLQFGHGMFSFTCKLKFIVIYLNFVHVLLSFFFPSLEPIDPLALKQCDDIMK